MVLNMRMKDDISPTLMTIIEHFDEDNSRPSNSFSCVEQSEGGAVYNDVDFDGEDIENCGNWNNDQDHVSTLVDESLGCADSASPNYNEVFLLPFEFVLLHAYFVFCILFRVNKR